MQTPLNDPILKSIVAHLKKKHHCHTAILYGSRARGDSTATSDYDVVGFRKNGSKTRIAKKKSSHYWDIFVYPEKDLKKLNEQHLDWKDGKVLFEQKRFGSNLLRRLKKLGEKPFKPAQYEIDVAKTWSLKQLERCKVKDVLGLYRRTELHTTAVGDYFLIRRKKYLGPKAGLRWLEMNDRSTFKLFEKVFKKSDDDRALKSLVTRVYFFGRNHGSAS